MKGRIALLLAALAVPAVLFAVDVLTEYKVDPKGARESLYSVLRGGLVGPTPQCRNFRLVPEGQRAAVVSALGAFAKAYFASDEFKKLYAEAYAADLPRKPDPPAGADSAMMKQLAKQAKMMERTMANVPPEMQGQMKQAMEQMKQAQAGNSPEQKRDRARYDKAMAEYNKAMADPRRLPKDPNELLRRRLRQFLAATADINFDAQLREDGLKKYFVDKTLEARPEEWKMWFRAGREGTTAARAFVTQWLKELR